MSYQSRRFLGVGQWLYLMIGLSVTSIAGNHVGLLPGGVVCASTLLNWGLYLLLGCMIAGMSCWLGAVTGREMPLLFYRWGLSGRVVMALAIVAVSIPATTLTGGWLGGQVMAELTGLPWVFSGLFMLILASVMALGYGRSVRWVIHYLSLLWVPLSVLLFLYGCFIHQGLYWLSITVPDWWALFAFVSYGACGFRIPLLCEVGSCMRNKSLVAVLLVIGSKLIEWVIMLLPLSLLVSLQLSGPLAFSLAVGQWWGREFEWLVHIILISSFLNVLIPAIAVNARHIAMLQGRQFVCGWMTALLICMALMWVDFQVLFFSLVIGGCVSLFVLIGVTVQLCCYAKSEVDMERDHPRMDTMLLAVATTRLPMDSSKQ